MDVRFSLGTHFSVSESGDVEAADGVQRSNLPPVDTAVQINSFDQKVLRFIISIQSVPHILKNMLNFTLVLFKITKIHKRPMQSIPGSRI